MVLVCDKLLCGPIKNIQNHQLKSPKRKDEAWSDTRFSLIHDCFKGQLTYVYMLYSLPQFWCDLEIIRFPFAHLARSNVTPFLMDDSVVFIEKSCFGLVQSLIDICIIVYMHIHYGYIAFLYTHTFVHLFFMFWCVLLVWKIKSHMLCRACFGHWTGRWFSLDCWAGSGIQNCALDQSFVRIRKKTIKGNC